MILLTLADFKNFHQLARSAATDAVLQAYIDKYEVQYIYQLLGKHLGHNFISDLDATTHLPTAQRFKNIFNEIYVQDDRGGRLWISPGMKSLLLSLVFYNYVFKTQAKHTQTGVVLNQIEVSQLASNTDFAEAKWNEALDGIETIQWYCKHYAPSQYPEYKGIRFAPKSSMFL